MIKLTLTLTVVMGVTWIGNLLFFNNDLVFVAYIMTIIIAAQGLIIFIVLVPLSQQVSQIIISVCLCVCEIESSCLSIYDIYDHDCN